MLLMIVGALGIVVLVAIVAIWWLRSRQVAPDSVGFREYVKDPRLRSRVSRGFAFRHEAVNRLAERPPEELVDMLLDDEEYRCAAEAISRVGADAVPALLAAVSNPEFRRTAGDEEDDECDGVNCSEPLTRVLECLQDLAPEDAVPVVAPLASDDNVRVRKQVAFLLGAIGSDSAARPLAELLATDDEEVKVWAMMGVEHALEKNRVTGDFPGRVFDTIELLVWRGDQEGSGEAPKCLLGLDRERAIPILTGAGALVPGREGLEYVLRALRENDVPVAECDLLSLVSALETKVDDYPNKYVVGEALLLLGKVGSSTARLAIERGMESASQHVREKATEAMATLSGVEDPFDRVFARLDDVGWPGLSEVQRHVLAVRIMTDEVCNGGWSQYFVNSSGDQWREAATGLEAMGALSDLALLREATSMFGPDGPSTDDAKRHKQLARVVRGDNEVFRPLERRFFDDEHDREVLLLKYIIANSSEFRSH